LKTITSFGTAFIAPNEPFYKEIETIGKYLAESGYSVCCGGYGGSMEPISKGAFEAGGKTIGIGLKGRDISPNQYLSEFILSENLMARILTLIHKADAYIVFKGGTGTLVELSVVLELMYKKSMPAKKMFFYSDFWKNTLLTLQSESSDLEKLLNEQIHFINEPEEIKQYI